ncbi:MAG: MGMT family protein [Elusimicrobiota bacterium]
MPEDFKKKVYNAIMIVPRGRVTTYGEIAGYLRSKAYRAVGKALAQNPHAPRVPCHRVVKSDGSIGGYTAAGGLKKKVSLLKKEGVIVRENRIVNFKKTFYSLKNQNDH